ncbi:cytochrome P450 [Streptomyces sp. MP131-18]|uniref:cytochrome P450 n=1 Tax=Streptomyces sp. MP131-18 TaxID=1857892 RepID=UPI00097C05B8|nr:cytochrome P450 [Streptomyces sp. MP131-18]ONK16172.1 Biotin biosynthesis cytochrome P450 [Streptomyces sp. MP131-18]
MSKPDPEEFHRRVLDRIEDPYPVYRAYREAGTLHRVLRPGTGRAPEWLVLGYEEAAVVLAGRAFGRRAGPASGAGEREPAVAPPGYPELAALLGNWLVFMDPPRHTRVRAVVAECIAQRLRTGVRGRLKENVGTLVDRLVKEPGFDLVDEFAAVVPMLTMLDLLGLPHQDHEWLRGQIGCVQQAGAYRSVADGPRLAVAERAAGALTEYFRTALARRRRDPRRDLLSLLLAAPWEEDLAGEDLLVATCVHLLAAGHETATAALSKSARLLLRDRALLAGLRAARDLVPAAVDEFLRLEPPTQTVSRWATQDEEVAGHRIGRGDLVTVVLGAANRDPAQFEEPDTVRFDRDSRKHCGFGMGGHYCLGSALARTEMEAGLRGLLDLLPGRRPAAGAVPYRRGLALHGPLRLPVERAE